MARKGKGDKDAGATGTAPTIAAHPQARASVARWKGIGGVGGLLLAAFLAWRAGLPAFDVGVRALLGGVVGYFLCWFAAVTVWKHLVAAEVQGAIERRRAEVEAEREARAAAEAEALARLQAEAGSR